MVVPADGEGHYKTDEVSNLEIPHHDESAPFLPYNTFMRSVDGEGGIHALCGFLKTLGVLTHGW